MHTCKNLETKTYAQKHTHKKNTVLDIHTEIETYTNIQGQKPIDQQPKT